MAKTKFTKASQTKTAGGAKMPNPWASGPAGGPSLGNPGAVAAVKRSPPNSRSPRRPA